MKRLLTAIVVNMILFSSMSIPVYASGGFIKKTVTTDLVKGAFVEDGVEEDESLDDDTGFMISESLDEPADVMDEFSLIDGSKDEHMGEPIELAGTDDSANAELVIDDQGLQITTEPEATGTEPIIIDEEEKEYEGEVQDTL